MIIIIKKKAQQNLRICYSKTEKEGVTKPQFWRNISSTIRAAQSNVKDIETETKHRMVVKRSK